MSEDDIIYIKQKNAERSIETKNKHGGIKFAVLKTKRKKEARKFVEPGTNDLFQVINRFFLICKHDVDNPGEQILEVRPISSSTSNLTTRAIIICFMIIMQRRNVKQGQKGTKSISRGPIRSTSSSIGRKHMVQSLRC